MAGSRGEAKASPRRLRGLARSERPIVVEVPLDCGFLSLPWDVQDAVTRHAAERQDRR